MHTTIEIILLTAYFVPAAFLMLYGLNLYFLLFLFLLNRNRSRRELTRLMADFEHRFSEHDLPHVVTQIPLYNEYNVAERAMRAAAAMEYPPGRHTIQILDDSTDETVGLVDRVAADLRVVGHDIQVVRREDRVGYKAGALAHGMTKTNADFFAIFDADFVPTVDFLKRTVPVMLAQERTGLVQARWGHLNNQESLVTKAQSIGIDGHFAIEQPARAWNNLFMNFNGTAGLWRRQAIDDAGGWQADTLTEDMDLSYRSQLAGWAPFFLFDLVVPAEVPNNINAFKSQQFRWAKGSTQTALKILPMVFRSNRAWLAKWQAVFHTTHYFIHPLMVWLAIMTLPVLKFTFFVGSTSVFLLYFSMLLIATCAPPALYAVSQRCLYTNGLRRLCFLPFLTFIGVGIALSNSRAVLEALMGMESAFIRTPKSGDRRTMKYAIRVPVVTLAEIALGLYCAVSLGQYIEAQKYLIGPFLLLYAFGFTFVGALSITHALGEITWKRLPLRTPSLSSA